jgi:hypothetical protein
MDHSKDNLGNNYLIFKLTISVLAIGSFFINFLNSYISSFLITTFIL